ncbi:MAG: hypothetical protein MJZ20_10235 [Bacteroidaceae bacterium]|nr:hypothetical protein [Bacteroidaceae bacterium]
MVTSIAVYANAHGQASEHNRETTSVPIHMEGKHCRGTVGCDCPGFAPITNGDEWQKAYCKHCGHKKTYHK